MQGLHIELSIALSADKATLWLSWLRARWKHEYIAMNHMTDVYQAFDLGSNIVFDVCCFAGPKGAVCLALSSKSLSSCAPIDRLGLTEHYIEGLPCPRPLSAGITGVSSHEMITLRPDSVGRVRTGVITHIDIDGFFVFRSENAVDELIEWPSIGEVDGEVMPTNMPVVDTELIFLMIRPQKPEYMLERMLYFSVRTRKANLIREIIRRLSPSSQILGRVLLMVWLHDSVLQSVCDDLSGWKDCCRILLDNGASISKEVAVKVSVSNQVYILSRKYVYYQSWKASRAEMFRQFQIAISSQNNTLDKHVLEYWFPLQLTHDGDNYIAPNGESITYDDGQWIFTDFVVVDDPVADDRQFYSSAPLGDRMPTLGDWIRFPDADCEESDRFIVSNVETLLCFSTFRSDKQTLLYAAEEVRRVWAVRGWRFRGASATRGPENVSRWMGEGGRDLHVFIPSDQVPVSRLPAGLVTLVAGLVKRSDTVCKETLRFGKTKHSLTYIYHTG